MIRNVDRYSKTAYTKCSLREIVETNGGGEKPRALVVMAKPAVVREVRTRLPPPVTPTEALSLYECMTAEIVTKTAETAPRIRELQVRITKLEKINASVVKRFGGSASRRSPDKPPPLAGGRER